MKYAVWLFLLVLTGCRSAEEIPVPVPEAVVAPEPSPTATVTPVPQPEVGIQDLRIGTGPEAVPVPGRRVVVHYTLWLKSDHRRLYSSLDAKRPFEFELSSSDVIRGFSQGVSGMKVGGKRMLTIPAELAYGAEGVSTFIPSNAELEFSVELLEVK